MQVIANIISDYISDQIKDWDVPVAIARTTDGPAAAQGSATAVIPAPAEPEAVVTVAVKRPAARPIVPVNTPRLKPQEAAPAVAPPAAEQRSLAVTGPIEKVIDTATIKIDGQTVSLAGIIGLGSPYRDQLAKFIEEQGNKINCTPMGTQHLCLVNGVDLALAALSNGAARLAPEAVPHYRDALGEAKRNKRGIFQ